MIFHFGAANTQFSLALPRGDWRIVLDSTGHSGAVRGERPREASLSSSSAPTTITLDLLPRSFLVLENTTSPGE
jgi:hypothetical protein